MDNNNKKQKGEQFFAHALPIMLIICVVVTVISAGILIVDGVLELKDQAIIAVQHSRIEESVTSGTVIEKKTYTKHEGGGGPGIVYNPNGGVGYGYSFGGSSSSRVIYELVVSYSVTTKDGSEYTGEKTFEVSEGAYLSYNVGDFFDSLNYENKLLNEG